MAEKWTDDEKEMPENSPPLRGRVKNCEIEGAKGESREGFSDSDLKKGFKSLKMPAPNNNSPDKGGFS